MGALMDRLRGRMKRGVGRATRNRNLEARGVAEETRGRAKGAGEEVKHGIRDVFRRRRRTSGPERTL